MSLCDPIDCSTPLEDRLLCLPLSSEVCSNSCPLSRGCYWTISPSVTPFSFCPESFPALGSFPMSWLCTSGGQSTGISYRKSNINLVANLETFWLKLCDLQQFIFFLSYIPMSYISYILYIEFSMEWSLVKDRNPGKWIMITLSITLVLKATAHKG